MEVKPFLADSGRSHFFYQQNIGGSHVQILCAFYEEKTGTLIMENYGVLAEYAQRLAVNVLDGIESHGGNPEDWETVKEAVRVVVAAWINADARKNNPL